MCHLAALLLWTQRWGLAHCLVVSARLMRLPASVPLGRVVGSATVWCCDRPNLAETAMYAVDAVVSTTILEVVPMHVPVSLSRARSSRVCV